MVQPSSFLLVLLAFSAVMIHGVPLDRRGGDGGDKDLGAQSKLQCDPLDPSCSSPNSQQASEPSQQEGGLAGACPGVAVSQQSPPPPGSNAPAPEEKAKGNTGANNASGTDGGQTNAAADTTTA